VSATVVIWDMPAPVISGEAVSTGASSPLKASDDYYMICYYEYGSGYYGNFQSPASNQIKVTTGAVNRYINLSWGFYNSTDDWVDGFYVPEDSEAPVIGTSKLNLVCKWDYYNMTNATTGKYFKWLNYNDPAHGSMTYYQGHRRWTNRYYSTVDNPDLTYPHTNTVLDNSTLFDGLALGSTLYVGRYRNHPEVAWMIEDFSLQSAGSGYYRYMINQKGLPFNTTHGKLGIEFTSVDDTWKDLWDALKANESYADRYMMYGSDTDNDVADAAYKHQLVLFGSMIESISSSDFLEISGKAITLIAGDFISGFDNDFYFKNCMIEIINYIWLQPTFKIESTKYMTASSSLVLTGTNVVSGFAPWNTGDSMTIYGSTSTPTYYGGLDLVDVSQIDFRYPKAGKLTNMNYYDAKLYITIRYNVDIYLYNQSFYNSGGKYDSYDMVQDWYSGQTDQCTVYCQDCESNRENGTVLVYYKDTAIPQNYLNYSFLTSHKYNVVGSDGETPLENVDIVEVDDNGNTYSTTTDANGEATNIVQSYLVTNDFTGIAHLGNYTYNHQWNVTITSEGYITKDIIISNTGSQDTAIKLEKPIFEWIAISNEATEGLVIN